MKQEEAWIQAEVEAYFEEGDRVDAGEDERYGPDRRSDELPEELRTAERRRRAIREAKAELAREAQEPGQAEPEEKAQRNFTDRRVAAPLHRPQLLQASSSRCGHEKALVSRAFATATRPPAACETVTAAALTRLGQPTPKTLPSLCPALVTGTAARTHEMLRSVIRTGNQRGLHPTPHLNALLCSPGPPPLALAPP